MNQNVVFSENKEHLAQKGVLLRAKERILFFREHQEQKEHFANPVLNITILSSSCFANILILIAFSDSTIKIFGGSPKK